MQRALELAALGPAVGPNPRVGCVIADAGGRVLGEGYHRGAGTAHAEVDALADAAQRGNSVVDATTYVTLEPCNHTGRTGPCTAALIEAGIARVRFAVEDPNPHARGGAGTLAQYGVQALHSPHPGAEELNHRWLHAIREGRPYVIAKWASTLDGRTAAADGTSFWITGEQARDHAHQVRAGVDAIIVGTATVKMDDPELSARPAGVVNPHQPLRVVMGRRDTEGAAVWRDDNALAVTTHNPSEVLAQLHQREVRAVLVEGGATLTSAFIAAGVVDEINAYIAPALLGAGPVAVNDVGIGTMNDALRSRNVTVTQLGLDTLITAQLRRGN
jgi:diaminohydroxyphosphoribosylaminopyrimidine deaminase/5-amino-6-(5-phosphoribosylamino)uracil reductase